MPIHRDGKFFTPSTEALVLGLQVFDFSIGDGESGYLTKRCRVVTTVLQLGDDDISLGIVEFSHALVDEFACVAMAHHMGE